MPSTITSVHTSAQTQEHKTAAHPFFLCNPTDDLLAVRDGVSSKDALNKAVVLLSVARDIAASTAEESGKSAPWAAPYLIEIAAGIIESVAFSMQLSAKGDSHV